MVFLASHWLSFPSEPSKVVIFILLFIAFFNSVELLFTACVAGFNTFLGLYLETDLQHIDMSIRPAVGFVKMDRYAQKGCYLNEVYPIRMLKSLAIFASHLYRNCPVQS